MVCARLGHRVNVVDRVIHCEVLVWNLIWRQGLLNAIIGCPHIPG